MVSDKRRLASLILCYLLGIFGAHRFYVGKHISGFFMLISLGGFGLWAAIDFLLILFGFFKDNNRLYVKIWCNSHTAPKLIIACLFMTLTSAAAFKSSKEFKNYNNLSKFKQELAKINQDLFKMKQVSLKINNDGSHDIIKYTDEKGVSHYVNDPTKIPEEYKNNAQSNFNMPLVNRSSKVGN